MKKLCWLGMLSLLCACGEKTKSATGREGGGPGDTTNTTTNNMADSTSLSVPYTATYSSNFNTTGVSNADMNLVMQTYKDWENGNVDNITKSFADSVGWDNADGEMLHMTNGQLNARWKKFRDSLSSVKVEMEAFTKMYATDKQEPAVLTWYKETDTYKNGKVDSAMYHDINSLKDGKIIYYRQYRRAKR